MSIDWKGERLGLFETEDIILTTLKESRILKDRLKMVTSDDPKDVFDTFDEVEAKFGNAMIQKLDRNSTTRNLSCSKS